MLSNSLRESQYKLRGGQGPIRACVDLPLRLASLPLSLADSCKLPAFSCGGLWGCANHPKSPQVAAGSLLLKSRHGLWRWGRALGAQGGLGNATVGGRGRPPGHHGVWSVAPTKSEQRGCAPAPAASLHKAPGMPCPDRTTMQLPAQRSQKNSHSACLNQQPVEQESSLTVRRFSGNAAEAVWTAGPQGSMHVCPHLCQHSVDQESTESQVLPWQPCTSSVESGDPRQHAHTHVHVCANSTRPMRT